MLRFLLPQTLKSELLPPRFRLNQGAYRHLLWTASGARAIVLLLNSRRASSCSWNPYREIRSLQAQTILPFWKA